MNLIDGLHNIENVWKEEIEQLLEEIEVDWITREESTYGVYDKIYDHVGQYAPNPDTRQEDYSPQPRLRKNGNSISFVWRPTDISEDETHTPNWTQWINEVNTISVRHQKPPRITPEVERKYTEEKYTIGGILVDPLITEDIDKAATHLREQFELVEKRIQFITDLQDAYYQKSSEMSNIERHTSAQVVKSITGIGKVTIQRLASYYGVPTNMRLYDKSEVSEHLPSSWGNQASTNEIFIQISEAVSQYNTNYKNGMVKTDLQPDDLTEYPKDNPTRITNIPTRTHTNPEANYEQIKMQYQI